MKNINLIDDEINVKQTQYQILRANGGDRDVETQLEQLSLREPSTITDMKQLPFVEILKNTDVLDIDQQNKFRKDEDTQLDELILKYYSKEQELQNGLFYYKQDQSQINLSVHIDALKTQKLKNIEKTKLTAFDKNEYKLIKHQQKLKH